jgi:hypothetical protein
MAVCAMPKRHDDLFGRIASFAALRAAARKAILGKRRKPGASAFMASLERELIRLEGELCGGTYRPGRYVEIVVRTPSRGSSRRRPSATASSTMRCAR